MNTLLLVAAVVVGTWNGNWFPSGRAEHRANPAVEDATTTAAAKMLAGGIAALDPEGTNDVILCLCEMRGPKAASNLVERIGRKGLRLVSISGYRRRDRFDMQQNAIATTLPVADAHWSLWRKEKGVLPPRGYAFAAVVVEPAVTARVYSVHLKSNYGATTPEKRADNIAKRESSASQIARTETNVRGTKPSFAIVAGDFNTDKWRREFAGERTIAILEEAGFSDLMDLMPVENRWTHPNGKYGNSALDHIFSRGFSSVVSPITVPSEELSDHYAFFGIISVDTKGAR